MSNWTSTNGPHRFAAALDAPGRGGETVDVSRWPVRAGAAVVAAVLSAALSGCTAGSQQVRHATVLSAASASPAPPQPSGVVTPSPTTRPSPTASPAPAPKAAVPATSALPEATAVPAARPKSSPSPTASPRAVWRIGFGSIGPLTTSMTARQMIDTLQSGASPAPEANPHCSVFALGGRAGHTVAARIDRMLFALAESKGATGRVDALSFGFGYIGGTRVPAALRPALPVTARGITLGSTLQQVKAAYAGLLTVRPAPYTTGGRIAELSGPADTRMRFETDAGGIVTNITVGRIPQVDYIEGCG